MKSYIEAGVERLGEGVAGLLILGIGALAGATTRTLGIAVAVVLLAWVVAWVGVRRGYIVELGRNVRRLSLGHQRMRVSLREADVIRRSRDSCRARSSASCFRAWRCSRRTRPRCSMTTCPTCSSMLRPRFACACCNGSGAPPGGPDRTRERPPARPDPQVRGEALVTQCALRREGILDSLERVLRSNDAGLRDAAIRCIAQYVEPDEEGRALVLLGEVLRALAPPGARQRGRGPRARPVRGRCSTSSPRCSTTTTWASAAQH